ncbi:Omp85 family outer membrane protein [Acetobacteroides hydrogenigenes]|uniref:Surface antigen-like protein n=1 Tax=Acetobacteroides hydrogenigenes TaxID=979970 RepID=A0A4R2E6P7_9BACT|nr:BamA/TamA family outer membrane protein [Acetobacteroides hydrogenigenes]TCN63733.1 surface antigen-like protein [Acetobacteroides hydrogenigenes]
MKKTLLGILLVLPVLALAGADTTANRKDEIVKKGWNLGPIPVIAFDSDLGFEYGAVLNFFNFGDGSSYPEYRHSIYTEASRYTKGSGQYRIIYDSKYVLPGIRLMADLQYLPTLAAEFYGFNGAESRFHKSWIDPDNADYRSELFYKMNKDIVRMGVDLQGKLSNPKWGWLVGTSYQRYTVGPLRRSKLSPEPSSYGEWDVLYNKYVDWGIVGSGERRGGDHLTLKGALIYDTRDNEPNPMRGIWADALIYYVSPSLAGGTSGHAKLAITLRKYVTLIPNDLSFAVRAMAQNVVAGKCPFYLLPQIVTVSPRRSFFEGLGGAYSLRGILRNRVMADGFALANAELRYKFWRMHLLRQNLYWAITAFADAGMVTQNASLDLSGVPQSEYGSYFRSTAQRPHYSFGMGGKLVMNQNFVISGDLGKAASSDNGSWGMYIGVNFLF